MTKSNRFHLMALVALVFLQVCIGKFYAATVPTDMPCFDSDGIPVEIAPTGNSWYVDCNRKGGPGDGKTLATAFQTLPEAMTNVNLKANDTVYAAPGEYNTDYMKTSLSGIVHRCRVVLPEGVRLVSIGSAADTVIVGSKASTQITKGYGIGKDAVRCVRMGANSMLRGFTLRDGYSYATAYNQQKEACYGGGIHADPSAVIIDCVISNCVATRGGGACRGTYINCRFDANRATGGLVGAHLVFHASLFNCILTGALGSCDWYVNGEEPLAVNCTFGPNKDGAVRRLSTEENKRAKIWNSLILSPYAISNENEYHYCFIAPGVGVSGNPKVILDNCIVTNLTETTIPSMYSFAGVSKRTLRPLTGDSRLVGAANLEIYLSKFPAAQYWLSMRDIEGKQRIWNNALDIGAIAYDRNDTGFTITVR